MYQDLRGNNLIYKINAAKPFLVLVNKLLATDLINYV